MQAIRWTAILIALALGFAPGAHAAERIKVPPEYWYDVQVDVPTPPPHGVRLVFGVVNGDVRFDNYARVFDLTTDGQLGSAVVTTGGTTATVDGGFRLDDRPFYLSKWVQQDVSFQHRISFRVAMTKEYPFKKKDPYQPDQFSFAVLEAESNVGYLKTNDPTTADALFSIDLKRSSKPKIYGPRPAVPKGGLAPWTVTVKKLKVPK
jgi:hypothetical protein